MDAQSDAADDRGGRCGNTHALDPFALGGRADPVLVLDAERRRLMQAGFEAQDAADAISATWPSGTKSCPTVQVGGLLTGPGDTYEPILAYSEDEIRAHCEQHRRARASVWGETHPCVQGVTEREERALAELRGKVEAQRVMEEACGYAALDRKATELVHAWCSIEDRLMETTATSAAGVLVQLEIFAGDIKWNEVPNERIDALIAVISAGARAIGGAQ